MEGSENQFKTIQDKIDRQIAEIKAANAAEEADEKAAQGCNDGQTSWWRRLKSQLFG